MILFNVIYVYLHTNQTKYIILSLFIYFFYYFPLVLLYVALLSSFDFFKHQRGKGEELIVTFLHLLWIPENSSSISPSPLPHRLSHAKKFCSETTVWESLYKLVVRRQVIIVFVPFDLTK